MADNAMSNLSAYVQKLKNQFLLQTGVAANLLLVPRRTETVKRFCNELVADIGENETGSVPFVFNKLWHENAPCQYMGLHVELSDKDDDMCVDRDIDQADHEPSTVQ